MTEDTLISGTPEPRTRETLSRDLRRAGVAVGHVVIVHAALSSMGWICGGPVTVIQALLDAVGPTGTVVMPSHSAGLTDPAKWEAPPVPPSWVGPIRKHMPAFDPLTTPTRDMGAVAELFRTWPGTKRSDHPTCSFAANGPLAEDIIADHALTSPLGERSPLGSLHRINADILLLGVEFDKCTMLHFAEQLAWPDRPLEKEGSPLLLAGERRWVEYEIAPIIDSEHFLPIGAELLRTGLARQSKVGSANSILVASRAAVECAVSRWRELEPL